MSIKYYKKARHLKHKENIHEENLRSYVKIKFSTLKICTHKNKFTKDLEDNMGEIYVSICVCITVQAIFISRNSNHHTIKKIMSIFLI